MTQLRITKRKRAGETPGRKHPRIDDVDTGVEVTQWEKCTDVETFHLSPTIWLKFEWGTYRLPRFKG